ncbi:MAG: hypothetical protein ABI238_00925 [Terrimesophilobacter sp.]
MQTPSGRPDRTLVVILSIITAVAVLALVVVFTRGAPAQLDPSTPEGVVQSYSNAVISGDRVAAMTLLTSDIRNSCQRADPSTMSSLRLTLVSTKINGDNATVRVSVSMNPGSGTFGGSAYETDEAFTLVRESGSNWKIETTPWELVICYKTEGNQ